MATQNDMIYHPDDIVISGISGVFPDSENFEEFKENLLAGKSLISSIDRCDTVLNIGAVRTIDRFDHIFFHLTHQQAQGMTIGSRILLEKAFEAILDSGYNPQQIKGKNVAVVCGIWECSDDGDPAFDVISDDFNMGLSQGQFMAANRISNFLDLHGPSCGVNTACSSSMYALDMAVKYIQSGQCEAAILCSPNFNFTIEDFVSPLLNQSGISAPFDANAGGYIRSEAVVAMFLQKRKHAKRIYANVIHSTTNCDGFKTEGFTYPSVTQQKQLYENFYKKIKIDPQSISYIEAHGTSTPVGDFVEGTSIEEFFCQGRTTPLKLGSVKSNIGHTEAAAALCGIAKLIVSFESGIIPPNINFKNPNPKIKGLHNGKLQVITEPTPMEGGYFALNSFGIGGANGHLVLTPHNKTKKSGKSNYAEVPRIVTVSGRTEEAVDYIFNDIEKNYKDEEYVALMHEIFSDEISGHLQRGYIILQEDKPNIRSTAFFSGDKRPIWFVFAGMGSQWPAMGKSLMNLPIFAESIRKCHQVLRTKNVDLIKIITDDDPEICDNILNSFVGIAAIQIALVDVLKTLGIQPDGIIGHSVGELGCAYADGCFTADQTILAAYYRGLVSVETELIHGTMAAVGADYASLKELVPAEIEIACRNSQNSCTLSGPTPIMDQFMKTLKEKNIFVRRVNTANIAYHSRYIAPLGPKMASYLKDLIPDPKLRSEKWICTSAAEDKWDTDAVKYSSGEYHTINILNPVLFEEGCRHIPSNAITIEIAPHGLLNAILKHSLPKTVANIPLTMKNHQNELEYFLNSLGRLYEAGCVPKLGALYPAVEFPVSRSTPTISSLIKWQHNEQWSIGNLTNKNVLTERNFTIRFNDHKYEFIKGHVMDGRNLYPGFGYLWLVLETVTAAQKAKTTKLPVVFENIRFERVTNVPKKGALKFRVTIQVGSKNFEVTENGATVATGTVRVPENIDKDTIELTPRKNTDSNLDNSFMSTGDFYKELRLRGYQYKGLFKNIFRANYEGTYGETLWSDNFVSFMDTMAQLQILNGDTRELLIPTFIHKIVINFEKHFQILERLDKQSPIFPVHFYPEHRLLCSGGIQISGWNCTVVTRQKISAEPILQRYQFIPQITDEEMEASQAIQLCVHITLQNTTELQVKTYELLDYDHANTADVSTMSHTIWDTLNTKLFIQGNVNILISSDHGTEIQVPNGITVSKEKLPIDKSSTLIALSNIRNKLDMLENIHDALKDNGFIITKESIDENISTYENLGFNVCFSRKINAREKIILLNKLMKIESTYKAVKLHSDSYTWITNIQHELQSIDPQRNEKLVMYAENDHKNGMLGFFNCIKREEIGKDLRCIYVMDEDATDFSLENPFYKSQLNMNLCQNVYKNGQWGYYCHLKFEPAEDINALHAFCVQEKRGNFSSFKWIQGSLNLYTHESAGENLAYVYYSSLNFKDIMLAAGKISTMETLCYSRQCESDYGFEFSGKDENGTRLMGMVANKAIATMVETEPYLTWKVPDYMTLEEAATIPVVYATVIFAFFFKINLRKGCSILIHAGSGGIGQAAINICLHYNCTIFTTVGSPEKVQFIRQTFPQIPESHIGNSRDTSFEKLIAQETKGRGVDVVLNSLAGEKLQASIRCLANGGQFLEIGKFDFIKNNPIESRHFMNNISFHSVQLDISLRIEKKRYYEIQNALQSYLDQGIIKPIKRTIFQANDVETAFRYMAAGKHIGKVLIKIRNEENDINSKPTLTYMNAKPRVLCIKYNSYVIIGGLGGFGMELADWLILRGARNLVLSSRTGIKNGYQSYRMKLWHSYGVNVVISTEDVTNETGVRNLLEMANSLGPIEGIFNLAVILKDDAFLNQTEEHFKIANAPKSIATMHLDNLSRKMCPHLKYFVMFSSAACSLGNHDQTNYGYANSAMERICEKRQVDHLPALAIQWGAIGDVGIIAELMEENIHITIVGSMSQNIKSCLETLDLFMNQSSHIIVSSMVVAEKRHFDSDIISAVANILGIKDLKTVNHSWTLPELGMDSIVGMELKQILELEFNVIFNPEDLRAITFKKLYQMKEEKENATKSAVGAKMKTQIQIFTDEVFTRKFIRRIPFDENHIEKPIEFEENPTVFMFPGIDGFAAAMEPLAKNLPGQMLCFQYYFGDIEDFSVTKLYGDYAKYIMENYNFNREFHLVGYSLGGLVAMGVANILEKHEKIGHIHLIDCSPSYYHEMRTTAIEQVKFSNEEQIQNAVCVSVLQTLLPTMDTQEYSESIKKMNSWQSKKKLCLSILSSKSTGEIEGDQLFERIYTMAKALRNYELPQVSLESSCVLTRCAENLLDLDDDYDLSQYFKNPIQIHKIDADHVTILHHPKTSEIIMESLLYKRK